MLTEQSNPRTSNLDSLPTLEILQLINAEEAAVALTVQQSLSEIALAVDAVAERIHQGGRLIYVGAGTSGRLGVLDAAECVPTFNTSPNLVRALIAGGNSALTRAVEGAEDDTDAGYRDLLALHLTTHDSVIGIAASGRTPYVLGALAAATEIGSLTVGISCNVPAPLLNAAQIKIGIPVGPEVITGSTRLKAGTAQKMVLNMISTAVMVKLGKVYGNLMVDVQITNQKLAERARRIITAITGVDDSEAAQLLASANNSVKVAVVMHQRAVSAAAAHHLLEQAHGNLRTIIG